MEEKTEKLEKLDFRSYRKRKSTDRKKYRKKWFKQTWLGNFLDYAFYKNVSIDLSPEQDGSLVKTIRKPRITKRILILVTLAIVIGVSFLPFNYEKDVRLNWVAFGNNFKNLFTPNPLRTKDWAGWWKFGWESFAVGIQTPLINSLPFLQIFCINFMATVLGAVLAIPVYYLCANNVNHNRILRNIVKVFNDILRCIPRFVICVIFARIMGIGTVLPAVLSIGLFSLGIRYQMRYEYLETLNRRPFESMRSCGATNLQSVFLGLHPEVKPMFFAYSIYTLEINIRASVVLGYIGISSTYRNALQIFIENAWYDYVGARIVPLFLVVAVLQIVSNTLVRKLR